MRTTVTIHRRDAVIDLAHEHGEWHLSSEDMLLIAPDVATTDAPSIDATDRTISQVEPEWEWIQENEDNLRVDYAGRWIAVVLNRVAAIGPTEIDVLRDAETLGYGNPFTFYVPTESEPASMAACS